MDSSEVDSVLREMKFMQRLPEGLRGNVAVILQEVSELRSVPEGAAWVREGEQTQNKGYILVKGAVAIQKTGAPEHLESAPELLGEIMQFNPVQLRTATVVATEDCVVMRFFWDDFWAKIKDSLSEGDEETVKAAIESFAWEHFNR